MDCPDCHGDNTRVTDTYRGAGGTRRSSLCRDCGVRWQSMETVDKASVTRPKVPIRPQGAPVEHPSTDPPRVVNQPSAPANGHGGVGGGLPSGPVLSTESGSLEADPTEVVSKSSKAPTYTQEFEAVWAHTGRRGNKFKAEKAWRRVGRPSLELIRGPWGAYLLSDRPLAGFVQDLSTWLNGRGHTQDWRPAVPRCTWHARGGRGPSRSPLAGCPDCKEHQARTAGRTSEPTPAVDALPDWAQVRETTKTPSADELQALRSKAVTG